MSALDRIRAFAESREAPHVCLPECALTYRDVRELLAMLTPAPDARPSAEPMAEGWVMTYPGYAERKHRGISVDADADGITTEESVTGYGGYTATVHVPLSVLRALLATQGLSIVPTAEVPSPLAKDVLQACESLSEANTGAWFIIRRDELCEKALRYVRDRRAAKART